MGAMWFYLQGKILFTIIGFFAIGLLYCGFLALAGQDKEARSFGCVGTIIIAVIMALIFVTCS